MRRESPAFRQSGESDSADTKAVFEAAARLSMRFVAVKIRAAGVADLARVHPGIGCGMFWASEHIYALVLEFDSSMSSLIGKLAVIPPVWLDNPARALPPMIALATNKL